LSVKIIHITGASGAGTTTLGNALHKRYGYAHFDTDDFFWEQTDPPYTQKREEPQRRALLENAMDSAEKCIVSGSLTGWGDLFIPRFTLVIYVVAPTEIRLQRLRDREYRRFRDRILPGGDMFEEHEAFIKWAGEYDAGGMEMRSALRHREWLKQIACPVLEVHADTPLEDTLQRIGL